MTLADAHVVAEWHYEGLYAVCDWEEEPEMLGDFLIWPHLYCSVRDEGDELVGFAQLARLQRDTDTLSLVWGLRPDLVDKRHGLAFVEACLTYAQATYTPLRFTLGAWAFNQRALHVYEQVGFRTVRIFNSGTRFGVLEFVEMVREESSLKPRRSDGDYASREVGARKTGENETVS